MGVIEFVRSPKGKQMTGVAYALGAAIVIVGALFKIQHWPGAGPMLCIGMLTEAVLFSLGAFDKPHKEFDWSIVYPELDEENEAEASEKTREANIQALHATLGLASRPTGGDVKGATTQVPEINASAMVEEQVKKLAEGVKTLNTTASQIGSIANAAAESQEYVGNLTKASKAASAFAASQASLTNSSDELVSSYQNIAKSISSASNGSSNFAQQMDGITKNISTINSVFELQVKSVNEQNEAFKNLSSAVSTIEASLKESANSVNDYKAQVASLASNLQKLNNVYGGMLSAMTIKG